MGSTDVLYCCWQICLFQKNLLLWISDNSEHWKYFWNNFIVLQANQTCEDTKLQVLKTTIKKLVISLWLCGLLMSPHVSGVHGYLSLIARKSAATWNVLCQFHQWLYDATCKLIYFVLYLLSVASKSGHKTKKHVLIGCQTWRVLLPDI